MTAERYPGTSGRTQGERKETIPAASAARIPTPAAGLLLISARTTTPEDTFAAMPDPTTSRLYDASGEVERLPRRFSRSAAAPGPALRRGVLIAVPVAVALIFEFSLGWPSRGAIADRRPRLWLHRARRPGRAARRLAGGRRAAGRHRRRRSASSAAMGARRRYRDGTNRAAAGYCFADNLRLAFAGFCVALGVMIAQGLYLPASDALPALFYGTIGGLIQAAWAGCVWLVGDRAKDNESGWDPSAPAPACAPTSTSTHRSPVTRSASAPAWRRASRSTASPASTSTATGSR